MRFSTRSLRRMVLFMQMDVSRGLAVAGEYFKFDAILFNDRVHVCIPPGVPIYFAL